MSYACGDYILAYARLHTNPSDCIKKNEVKTSFFLVEHTAKHPNLCPVVQVLALYRLVRIGSGGTLVESGGIEPPSKNLFLSASPSADVCLSFPYMTDKNQTVIFGSPCIMTVGGTHGCSRSPLNDALTKPRYSLVGRPPNQAASATLLLSVNFKLRILKRFRTAARFR